MYLLYLDDSGSTRNPAEEYFVLGGICVPEPSVRWLSHQLEELAREINPADPRAVEFHASEIYSGRKTPWDRFNKSARADTIKRVLLTLQQAHADVVTFAWAVHKPSFPNTDPVLKAFEELSSRFDLYLNRGASDNIVKHRGLIVLDKSSYEDSLQDLAAKFRAEGNRWGSYLRNICEVPLFVDSRASRIIQLADHVAYAVFRRYNAGDLNYFNCIEGRFDQDNGIIHGLVHSQTYNRSCTCPACITRQR